MLRNHPPPDSLIYISNHLESGFYEVIFLTAQNQTIVGEIQVWDLMSESHEDDQIIVHSSMHLYMFVLGVGRCLHKNKCTKVILYT